MRNRLAEYWRTVRDRCAEFMAILCCALDDGPIEPQWSPAAFHGPAQPAMDEFLADFRRDVARKRASTLIELDEELQALIALFPRCTECGGDVERADWNAQLSPSRKNRVAHVACPFSSEVPDDGEW